MLPSNLYVLASFGIALVHLTSANSDSDAKVRKTLGAHRCPRSTYCFAIYDESRHIITANITVVSAIPYLLHFLSFLLNPNSCGLQDDADVCQPKNEGDTDSHHPHQLTFQRTLALVGSKLLIVHFSLLLIIAATQLVDKRKVCAIIINFCPGCHCLVNCLYQRQNRGAVIHSCGNI